MNNKLRNLIKFILIMIGMLVFTSICASGDSFVSSAIAGGCIGSAVFL